jgi:hypothetical protein
MRLIARLLTGSTVARLLTGRTRARIVEPIPPAPGTGITWDSLTDAWSTYTSVTWADWT